MPKSTTQDAPAVEDFDLDSWIDDARLPERSVTVYGRADLVAEHAELEEELTRLRLIHGADDRLVDPSVEVASRMQEVSDRMQKSALTFRFRALTRAESKVILSEAPKGDDGEPDADHLAAAWLAASSVSPQVSREQVDAIRAKIGEGQFNSLWSAAWGVSNDRRPNVPFSLAASVVLNSKDS